MQRDLFMNKPDGWSGGCACGAVRFIVHGAPRRMGLCHCEACKKAHAAAFNAFAVFARADVQLTGNLASWQSSPGYDRRFCPACGSRVMGILKEDIELSVGSFDDRSAFTPQYESWVMRRDPWVAALAVPQHERNRE
jgi:hypothetical protein